MAQRRIKREDERMTCVHVNHGADVNLPGDPAISEDRFEQVGAGMSVTCPIFKKFRNFSMGEVPFIPSNFDAELNV